MERTIIGNVMNRRDIGLRITCGDLLNHKVTPERTLNTEQVGGVKSCVTKANRRGEKTIQKFRAFLRRFRRKTRGKHSRIPHAEVTFERVHFEKVKIDQPRTGHKTVRLILCVIAVGQAGIEAMMRSFGIDRTIPSRFLEQENFSVSVIDRGKGSGAGSARIVVGS